MDAVQGTVAAVSCNDTYAFTKPVKDEIELIAGLGVKGDAHAGVHVKHRSRVRADPTQPNFRQVHLIQQELFAEVGAKGYAVAAGNLGENVTTSGIDLLGLPVGTILRFGPPAAGDTAGATAEGADGPFGEREGGPFGEREGGPFGEREGGPFGEREGGSFGERESGARKQGDGGSFGERESGAREQGDGGPLKAVLDVAARAELDRETAASAVAIAAAAAGDRGDDLRPAVVLAGLRNPCEQINRFRAGLLREVVGRDAEGNLVRKAGVMGVVLRGGAVRAGDLVTVELPPLPHAPLERV